MSDKPTWGDHPIRDQIREAGLDNAAPLASSTCSFRDPFEISGCFNTYHDTVEVRLQTNNPTTQSRGGQLFVQRTKVWGEGSFNKRLANMLRRLADSVEFEWENEIVKP